MKIWFVDGEWGYREHQIRQKIIAIVSLKIVLWYSDRDPKSLRFPIKMSSVHDFGFTGVMTPLRNF